MKPLHNCPALISDPDLNLTTFPSCLSCPTLHTKPPGSGVKLILSNGASTAASFDLVFLTQIGFTFHFLHLGF
ncbi:hypothetical protein AOLI_G00219870 [Acnodon oligacanthus]